MSGSRFGKWSTKINFRRSSAYKVEKLANAGRYADQEQHDDGARI